MNITLKRAVVSVVVGSFFLMALAAPAVPVALVVYAENSAPGMVVTPPPMPIDSGFVQFNNLTVESVSASNPPAEILASNQGVYLPAQAVTNGGGGSGKASAGVASCYRFNAQDSAAGAAIQCPTMPVSQPYRIEVDASAHLMLRDRTVATLGSFSSGDQINVFGYYNNDGSIQAYLIRDLSKPVQEQVLQLNNVQLVSISTGTTPATLVVTQSQGYPCYGFGTGGAAKTAIMCPMGATVSSAGSAGSALKNLSAAAMMPNWDVLRKYVVTITAQTVILDSNRTSLSLSDLKVGDSLNVYGGSSDNGQTITADIVRDLSIPATPSTFSGKVIQVNSDGSFVIQTNDGQNITVQSPIQVGATIQLTGLLNRLTNTLSQVSNIYFGGNHN